MSRRQAESPLQELTGAALHCRGCPARKRQQQNALRVRAVEDQVRDTIRECIGLAGTGAGNDKQRSVVLLVRRGPMLHREPLRRVERRQEVAGADSAPTVE